MMAVKVEVGQQRGDRDGSRRYTPFHYSFDSRAHMLNTVIEDTWEPDVRDQWLANRRSVREGLIYEFGVADYEQKIENFAVLGPAPWSVVALHNVYLAEARAAFVTRNYYPALLGACGLGERILNQLVLTLRDDYVDEEATRHVQNKQSLDDWAKCIRALKTWGVFDDDLALDYMDLMRKRHSAVHYRSELDSGDARSAALEALLLLGSVVERVFVPLGAKRHYFSGPIGRSYVCLDAESEPFVRRFILPACVLVSPIYRFVHSSGPAGLDVYDDPDYGATDPPLSDEEFAEPERCASQVAHPF